MSSIPGIGLALAVLLIMSSACDSSAKDNPFSSEVLAEFDEPWALAFLPDGRLLMTHAARIGELDGRIYRGYEAVVSEDNGRTWRDLSARGGTRGGCFCGVVVDLVEFADEIR